MASISPRLLSGYRLREFRRNLGLGQVALAHRLGLSPSYVSQLETGERQTTAAVILAFANAFPLEWAQIVPDDEAALLVKAAEAAADPTVAGAPIPEEVLRKAARQQPLLARRLAAVHAAYRSAQAQLAALDDTFAHGPAEPGNLPWEEVRTWFQRTGNYVDELDRAAERVRTSLDMPPLSLHAALERRLTAVHGTIIEQTAVSTSQTPLHRLDQDRHVLTIDAALPAESARFFLAHQLARLEMGDIIQRTAEQAALHAPEARRLLSVGLANYAAGALLMPYGQFREAARASRHDIDTIRQRFGVSFEQACHRLSTLQRPGLRGIPFFFCRVDLAGNITKRHSATRLQFAQFGGTCPLWIVHEAAAIPDRILVQLAELPEGTRYVSMAKGLVKPTGSYRRPARRYAVAIGCEITHADDFIYADQLDTGANAAPTPIGISCRICPRTDCEQRAFPPVGRALHVDPDERLTVPYSFS